MAFIELNGLQLFWHEAGTQHRDGPPGSTILFVHGFQGNAGVWRRQFETLSDRFHTVCLNNRGRAPSEVPEGVEQFNLDPFAADLDAFVEAQGYDQFCLAGWSMGVSTCLSYLKNHGQERVNSLILIDGSPNFQKFPRPPEAQALIDQAAADAAGREIAPPGETPTIWGEHFSPISADCREGSQNSLREADFLPFLLDIAVPTAVFHGRHDERIPFEAGQALADGIPSAALRNFTVSGHSPMWTEPGRFDREISSFLARVNAREDRESYANRQQNQRYQRR